MPDPVPRGHGVRRVDVPDVRKGNGVLAAVGRRQDDGQRPLSAQAFQFRILLLVVRPDGIVTPGDDRAVVHEGIQEPEDLSGPNLLHDNGLPGGVPPGDPALLKPDVPLRIPFPVSGPDS